MRHAQGSNFWQPGLIAAFCVLPTRDNVKFAQRAAAQQHIPSNRCLPSVCGIASAVDLCACVRCLP